MGTSLAQCSGGQAVGARIDLGVPPTRLLPQTSTCRQSAPAATNSVSKSFFQIDISLSFVDVCSMISYHLLVWICQSYSQRMVHGHGREFTCNQHTALNVTPILNEDLLLLQMLLLLRRKDKEKRKNKQTGRGEIEMRGWEHNMRMGGSGCL